MTGSARRWVDGLQAVTRLALQQHLLGPIRRKRYDRRSSPFLYRSSDGLIFSLDPHETVDRHIAVDGIYERRFLTFAKKVLPPGAVMLDVGANIGNHALFLKDVCSEIHCFEPNPRAIERLERNIRLNAAKNVHVHGHGLGSSNRQQPFHDNVTGNLGGSRFVGDQPLPAEGQTGTRLPIRHADEAISALQLPRIDFIKVDVEGFEPEVFDGLRATIATFRPVIAFEHHAKEVDNSVYREILDNMPGYRVFELTFAPIGSGLLARTLWHFSHRGEPQLTPVEQPDLRSYENLIAVPQERVSELALQFELAGPGAPISRGG